MSGALSQRHCRGEAAALDAHQVPDLLAQLDPQWSLTDDRNAIHRTFRFRNYYQTLAFVNALAWIAHKEDHHPELVVGYNRCAVTFSTHSAGGLSENDFICAARIDALDAGRD